MLISRIGATIKQIRGTQDGEEKPQDFMQQRVEQLSRKNPAITKSVVTYVSQCLKLADEEKLPIENYFSRHRHSVSSCDGDGAFNLISLFVLSPRITFPGAPESSIITTICMRVHDNIRNTMILPSDCFRNGMLLQQLSINIGPGKTMDEYYDAFVE